MGEIYTNAPEDDAVMAILGGFAFMLESQVKNYLDLNQKVVNKILSLWFRRMINGLS